MLMKNNWIKIKSAGVQDWMSQNGIKPVNIWYDNYYYEGTPQFFQLLESYNIRNFYFKNKFER